MSPPSRRSKRLADRPDPVVLVDAHDDDSDFDMRPVSRRSMRQKAVNKAASGKNDEKVKIAGSDSDFVDEVEEGALMNEDSKRKLKRLVKSSDEESDISEEIVTDAEAQQRGPHSNIKGKAPVSTGSDEKLIIATSDSDFVEEIDVSDQRIKKAHSKRKPKRIEKSSDEECVLDDEALHIIGKKPMKRQKAENKAAIACNDEKLKSVMTDDVEPIYDSDFVDEDDEEKQAPFIRKPVRRENASDEECALSGEPVPDDEARKRWPHRYINRKVASNKASSSQDSSEEFTQAKRHFIQAIVDGVIYSLGDDAHVKAADGEDDYICKIVEFFEAIDGLQYFRAQWFYRAKDTVIQNHDQFIHKKRVFLSEIKDDNPIDCLVTKLKIVPVPSNADEDFKEKELSNCDFYFDMMYLLPFTSFTKLSPDVAAPVSSTSTTSGVTDFVEVREHKLEMKLLDLYSGCGAMSTGLCLGANMNGVNLVTKWAVDLNEFACDSLRFNHPETQVRNGYASDFLSLIKEWKQLCASCSLLKCNDTPHPLLKFIDEVDENEDEDDSDDTNDDGNDDEIFEVEELLEICFGDPKEIKKPGLYFKVRWKTYGPDEDTWEPLDGLCDCPMKIKEFVCKGYKENILPLPGDVDVICGGPPCQGISGFNRFRNKENPLADEKNKQLIVYMDIVEFLKPRFVLMENVVDLIKFSNGFLGRHAMGRLVGMNYQARMGMMAAGAYGLPQYRMRIFVWGALMSEKLPQYPLPTHKVLGRGVVPTEFESSVVACDEVQHLRLKEALVLGDAISDLPPVENDEGRDEMAYGDEPETAFQRCIRMGRDGMMGKVLYDHRPLKLNTDDHQRVCHIPKQKGANFRDLEGVLVRPDNKVEWDPKVERVYLPSGKPLVPDYAMTFVRGSSTKPFGRLWWDEIVPTVVTRAEPHNQIILHPMQNRVLTIRENARLQGFPDYYKLKGPIKERYMQVGNAVAVPAARALGYSLAFAMKGLSDETPLCDLPDEFAFAVE